MSQENNLENKKNGLVFPILFGILSAFAMCFSGKYVWAKSLLVMIGKEFTQIDIAKLLFFVLLVMFYCHVWKKYRKNTAWIVHAVAILFSVFMLIGLSYAQQDNWDFIFGGKKQLIIALLVFIGYYIFFDIVVTMLYVILGKVNVESKTVSNKYLKVLDKYSFWIPFGVIFVCWLPFLIVHYPGSVPHDGYSQINQFFGIETFSNAHPWVSTLFLGVFIKIGRVVSDNFGVFVCVLVLYTIQAACYAYGCKKLKDWNASMVVRISVILYFAIVPVFGEYAPVIVKDGIFSALFALFMTLCVDYCVKFYKKEEIKKIVKHAVILTVVGIFVCLMRNNGIYLVIPAVLSLIFFVPRKRIKVMILAAICILIGFQGISVKLAGALEIAPGSKKEMLSIPFQQTARYLKEYPEDVTEEEYQAIEKILTYGELAERYDPEKSDNVKNTFYLDATGEDMKAYFKAWFSMFLRHPGVYFESFFNNTFGYYYPFYNYNGMGAFQSYIKGAPVATGDLDIHYVFSDKIRSSVDSYAEAWRNIPVLAQIMNPGTYTWILLLLLGYLGYCKKWKGMLVLIPPILSVAVCIASPVNGLLRYAIPVMACIPMIIYWCLFVGKLNNIKN